MKSKIPAMLVTGKCRDAITGRVSVTVALAAPGDLSPDDQVTALVAALGELFADVPRVA